MPGDFKGWHSRGFLPHFDSPERIQHLVFRTKDSLPSAVLAALPSDSRAKRRIVASWLDRGEGTAILLSAAVANIVQQTLLHFDGARYRLMAWCIMPNHVHAVMEPLDGFPVGSTVRGWKAISAASINRLNETSGPVWARDYFDRYARSESDLERIIGYVEHNPVAAGLVATAREWPWSSAFWREPQERA